MAAPVIINSTETGAPKFSGTLGAAIPVFDYILVGKLGWSKEFSGLNKAVYRSPAGKRRFYRIDDTLSGTYQGNRKYKITMYESMSDVDTGLGASRSYYGYKSNSTDTAQRNWIVIGDSAGIYLRSQYGANADIDQELAYIGDGVPIFSNDEWLSIIMGRSPDDSYASLFGYLEGPTVVNSSGEYCCAMRKRDGIAMAVPVGLAPGGGVLANSNIMGSTALIPSALNYPVDGKLLYTRPIINDGAVRSLRGYFPGLYCSEHGAGLIDQQIYPDGNKDLMALRICPNNNVVANRGWVLIDIGEGFRL